MYFSRRVAALGVVVLVVANLPLLAVSTTKALATSAWEEIPTPPVEGAP